MRTLQTIDRALAVIDLLSNAPEGLKLSAMARELDLKTQTLLGIVRSLQASGVVSQEGMGGTYFLGSRINVWQQRWLDNNGPAVAAREIVEALANTLAENVILAELRGSHLIALVQADAQQEIMLASLLDSPDAIHTMSTSKLLIAFLPERQREAMVKPLKLPKLGPNSITKKADFRQALQNIRERGYALAEEERCQGVVSLAVPVREPGGRVCAALGVSMPSLRVNRPRLDEVLKHSQKAAREIEQRWFA